MSWTGLSPSVRAVLVLLLGIFLLDIMGAMVKSLLPHFSAQELSAWRNLIGMIPSLILLAWRGEFRVGRKRLIIRQWPLALLRGVFVTFAQLSFYYSLGKLEFATVSALSYTSALFAVALSVPVLKEKVGMVRWAAVLLGFLGAISVVNPGSETFSPVALLPLVAAFLYAASSVSVRLIDRDVPNTLLYLYSAFAAAIGSVTLALLTTGFSPVYSVADLLRLITMGLFGGTGVLCLLVAWRLATPSILAPFNYFGILSAFIIGWLIFDEAPVDKLFPGVLLIVAGGLLIIWRERRVSRVRKITPII
ncbi:MAG: DMT family transporter [Alphaproteobacteria bacterium]|nr:DMT family transporter [Alphaproteobacteria bacterium]